MRERAEEYGAKRAQKMEAEAEVMWSHTKELTEPQEAGSS